MMGSPRALCDLVFRANLVPGMGDDLAFVYETFEVRA